jgi:Skp family chaperone for outer membrane proteins
MHMLTKMAPLGLLMLAFSLTATGQSSSPAKLGYVSPQRIFVESAEGKAEVAKLQALQQQKATELQTRQKTLQTTRERLAQAADGPERTQLMLQEFQQRADLERANVQAQQELQNLQRQAQAQLQARVNAVFGDLAKAQNLQLVLNSDTGVVWAGPGLDLTSAVIERLNATSASKP